MNKLSIAVGGIILCCASLPAGAQIDYFLKLDGIQGSSTAEDHENWSEIQSFSWGFTLPAGNHVGRPTLTPLSYTMAVDRSVPKLVESGVLGKTIDEAFLDVVRSGGEGDPLRFLQIRLEDVHVTAVSLTGAASDVPTAAVSLAYDAFRIAYTTQDAKGGRQTVEVRYDGNTKSLVGDASALAGLLEVGGSFEDGGMTVVAGVPEPETYALMLAGLGLVALAARRRRGQRM